MDIVASTSTVTFTTQFGAPMPAFSPGDVIEAKVLQLLAGGRARLAVGAVVIDVETEVPLVAGTTVHLAVRGAGEAIKLVLLESGMGGGASVSPSPRPAVSTPPGLSTTDVAAAKTAASQGGPTEAADALAIRAAQSTPLPASAVPVARSDALAVAVRGAAARQNGLTPLFADAAAALASPSLSPAVRQAAEQLLALRPALSEKLSAADVKQAFDRSGLLFEARMAAADGVRPTTSGAGDLKAALVVFRQVIKMWLGVESGKSTIGSIPLLRGMPSIVPNGGAVVSSMSMADPEAGVAPPTAIVAGAVSSTALTPGGAPASAAPPPPYRGAPTVAQSPVPASLASEAGPLDIGKQLLGETEAALSRQTLLQAASLPERAGTPGVHTDPANARWYFEVPFATPQGTTIAQFEIARDGHKAAAAGAGPVWRARFSLDIEPMGPVHAQVALIGSRAAVTLWAERPDSAARLRDNTAQLRDALQQAELEPGDVLVRGGTPPRQRETAAPAGRFIDCAS